MVGSFDVAIVFDSIGHEIILEAMLAREAPDHIAAAVMQELRDFEAAAAVSGIATVKSIPVSVGGRQGGTETTTLWNLLMEYLPEEVVDFWNVMGCGFKMDHGPFVNHMIWVDNIYLVALSMHEL